MRPARAADAAALARIYKPYVLKGWATFEAEPPSPAEFRARLRRWAAAAPWLVYEEGGEVLGYAYAKPYHERAAYRWTVETTVYVDARSRGRGIGRALYAPLLAELRRRGYRCAIGAVALPNPASVRLHESFGFKRAGVLKGVGWKLGGWRDVGYWQLDFDPRMRRPQPLR